MQREQVSIPKLILYVLLSVLLFVLQTSILGGISIFGYRVDLLPALVAAAALLDGPREGAVVGIAVGLLYDLSTVGTDGLYPIFFLLFGLIAGGVSRLSLSRNYISMLILTAAEMLLSGLMRYVLVLMRLHASLLLVLRQIVGGTLLTCLFCFIVYLPMRRLSNRFSAR